MGALNETQWIKGDEWLWKWYDTQLCAQALADKNQLVSLTAGTNLESIILNTNWFYKKRYLRIWNITKPTISNDYKRFKKVIYLTERYIRRAEKALFGIRKSSKISLIQFKRIKQTLLEIWYVFVIDLGDYMDILLQDVLKDSTFTPREVEYIKNYISTPLHPLAWQKELVDLVKIAQHLHKSSLPALTTATLPKPVQKAIQEHLQKYAWLPYDKPDAIPYTFADILVHLQEALKNPVLKYKQSVLSSRIRYKLTKKQSTFIELLRKHTYYDNYAADLYGELDYLLQRYLCKTYGVLFKDVTWYSWKELEQLYKNGKQVSPKRLALRKHYRVMVCNRKILRVYDGKTAYHRYRPRVATVSSPVKQPFLYGLCAYPGRAKGHVTVVVSTNDIAKVQKGDILVAQMTRPDLIFAMRKAAAIITDTGGMTSHAAIVAREFQIPCIVGTTNATKRLKDGDLVEVRSHRGMVTILS